MEHEINILVVEPGRPPRPARVDNSLETFSQLVGGELAMGCFLPQRVMLLYNEDASRHGLPPNRCNPFVNECIRPCPTPTALPFQKELSVRNTSGGRAPSSQPFLETTIFSLTVHAHSCCQSENIFFKCLLKRVIDPSVLNHSIRYDNNANRITCQELFLDFFKNNKYDRLIK